MRVFELRSENLTELGGPMGTEHTWDNWRKLFHDLVSAKKYAERDYKGSEKIQWVREGKDRWHTQDLSYVMYNIHILKIS